MIRFFLVLLGSSLLIGMGGFLAVEKQVITTLPSFFVITLIFLVFSTGMIYRYLFQSSQATFVQLYLLTMAVKLLAYGAYNTVVILFDKPGAFGNVVFFLIVYVLFTALEIAFLYRKISAH